jgi:2-(3-amino-3-carboxypropyl)histidine synthase
MDQTTIKTLYVFVEIGIDSAHLAQTIRMNFPDDRELFHRNLLDSEEANAKIPIGSIIGTGRNLQIEDSSSIAPFDDEPVASSSKLPTRLSLVSTIQFVAALQRLKEDLSLDIPDASKTSAGLLGDTSPAGATNTLIDNVKSRAWTGVYEATIPRSKPLSPGEILGCTAPRLQDIDALM